jgi:hypothetical protein
MMKSFVSPRHAARGSMLLETLIAATILTFASLAFGSGMIAATHGQNTAAAHARATEIANYLLEYARRDPNFWNAGVEYVGSTCTTNCWNIAGPLDPNTGLALPAYNDTYSSAGGHAGFRSPNLPAGVNWNYTYLWKADYLRDSAGAIVNSNDATITVWVFTHDVVNGQTQNLVYSVSGMTRSN